jgi:hypothetical protein
MMDEYRAVGGMKISKGNRSTWRKHAQLPICSPSKLNVSLPYCIENIGFKTYG